MSRSFTEVLQALKDLFNGSNDLQSFAQQTWKKKLAARISFKNRVEVNTAELPLILITRPHVTKKDLSGVRDGVHTVRLYCGFQQPDREQALLQLVALEETIDDLLVSNFTLGGTAQNVEPSESLNDEGRLHPVYFMVMDLDIHHRR